MSVDAAEPRLLLVCAVFRLAWVYFSGLSFMDKVCKIKITIHIRG
jgi:hypothetical protein